MNIACVLLGGKEYDIEAGGRVYHFEMHPYCGPTVLTKRGAVAENQPDAKSPFWEATRLWDKQGRRVDERGRCVWDVEVEPAPKLKHLGGRNYLVLVEGDGDEA